MGCGGGVKETNETVRRQPFSQARIPPAPRQAPADVRGKLPAEVMEGFAKIIKSFYNVGTLKPPIVTARPANETKGAPTKEDENAQAEKAKTEAEARRRAEAEAEEAKRLAEFSRKQVANPFQDLLKGEQSRAAEEAKATEERRKQEEQRYSPEPPPPEQGSDDEEGNFEDAEMRKARLEKERRAKEEAERRASELRQEEERIAAQRKGAMNNMQSEADNILSKYQ